MTENAQIGHFKQKRSTKTPTCNPATTKARQSRKAPEGLDQLIQLANLPRTHLRLLFSLDDFPAPPPGDWPKDFPFRAWAGKQDSVTLHEWLDQRLKDLPQQFREYVTGNGLGSTLLWFFGAVGRYEFVRDLQNKFRAILRAVREAEATGRLPISLYLETHDATFIDESWILRKQSDRFDSAVFGSGQKFDARMIRQCEICSLFFFARRKDSRVCDPHGKCAVTLSKRRERANAKLRAQLASKKKRAKTARER